MRRLHDYQKATMQFGLECLRRGEGSGWFLDPGLGKTFTALRLIQRLLLTNTIRVLVVGPLRVIKQTWPEEIALVAPGLSYSICHGTPGKRSRALQVDTDIVFINHDNMAWLQEQPEAASFDLIIVDESTAYKTWSARRSKALRKLGLPCIILTGTPCPETAIDLYPQVYLLDRGKRLGKNITEFRRRYCHRGGFENKKWLLNEGAEEQIKNKIRDICIYQSALEHLDMPEVIHNQIKVKLPREAKKLQEQLKESLLVDLEGNVRDVMGPGGSYGKLRQLSGGAYYLDDGSLVRAHEAKIEALRDLYTELNGKRLLVAYCYTHEGFRIQEAFPEAKLVDGKTKEVPKDFSILACQVAALSHGIDGLQRECSDVCWFTLTSSREIFQQFNARIYRQGQQDSQVRIHYLMAEGSSDAATLRALNSKGEIQKQILEGLRADA